MHEFNPTELKQLYIPPPASHKGQNGKLMIVGGSHLFHAASLWALEIASKIVDMVFYSSVPENNAIVQKEKQAFRNGIVVPRDKIEDYMEESDAVLLGPGMVRASHKIKNQKSKIKNIKEIDQLKDEGEQTYYLTKYLLEKYPQKKWVIDAGALQMLDVEWLKELQENVILTPHQKEFETAKLKIKNEKLKMTMQNEKLEEQISDFANEYNCTILLKGEADIVCSPKECTKISGGNAGMTKGGTGDVLAGLIGAFACKNDLFLSAKAGSFINKKAGENLYKKVGYYFNASDLVHEIPLVMKELFL